MWVEWTHHTRVTIDGVTRHEKTETVLVEWPDQTVEEARQERFSSDHWEKLGPNTYRTNDDIPPVNDQDPMYIYRTRTARLMHTPETLF